MSNERVCLSALRGISAQAASILDRSERAQAIWVPVAAFKQFTHTLYWGNFEELDLHLLNGLDPDERSTLVDELRAYHTRLRRQQERVSRFHRAYRRWLEEHEQNIHIEYREREARWKAQAGAGWWSDWQSVHESEKITGCLEEALRQLELSPGATLEEIRLAHRARAKALHPDRQGEEFTAQMVALNRAYEFICRYYRAAEQGIGRARS